MLKTDKHRKLNGSRRNNSKGFSLLELVITLVVSAIVLGGLVVIFKEFIRTHRRQERVTLIERSMQGVDSAMKDALSLPGAGLGTSSGSVYSVPLLPFAGNIFDGNKNTPIRLGIITPYKLNGNDAFTLTYSDATIPRLPLDSVVTQIGSSRIVRVPLPSAIQSTQSQANSAPTSKGDLLGGTKGELEPNLNPSPNTSDSLVPIIPSAEMFETGQLMVIVDAPTFSLTTDQLKPTFATLVKLNNVKKISVGNRSFLQFTLDICQNGSCGELTNDPLGVVNISLGSILVPIKFTSFYLQKDSFGNKLIKNDGGLILPGSDGFRVIGGKETIVGETDSFNVSYYLKDGSIVPTPSTPLVPWLNDVVSIDVMSKGAISGTQGTEYLERSRKRNFSILVRSLE